MRNLKPMMAVVSLGLLASSLCLAQVTTKNSVSNEISATHDFIDAVVNKVDGQMSGNSIHSQDYEQVKAIFRTKIRFALSQFEAHMNQNIFQPLSVYVDEYNRVYRDPSRSEREKNAQLAAKLSMLNGLMAIYQQQYNDYLVALYSTEPSLRVREIKYTPTFGKSHGECTDHYCSILEREVIFEDSFAERLAELTVGEGAISRKLATEKAQRFISSYKDDKTYGDVLFTTTHAYRSLMSTCATASPEGTPSQYCISSSIADHLEYYMSVQSALDRPINVTLADGKRIHLAPVADQLQNLTIRSLQSIQLDSDFGSYPFNN